MKTRTFSLLSIFTAALLNAGSIATTPIDPSLVVYNGNLGLVHETRKLTLDKGAQALTYKDVASTVVTDSVNVTFPKGVTLYSQQYRFDQINAHKLAQAHVDKTVKFYVQTGSELVYKSGTLLSASSQAVIKTDNGDIYTVPTSALIFSEIPKALITKPSLVWNIHAQNRSNSTMDLDYLVNNISWKSNYVLNIHKNRADLSGWISIDNRSGKAFKETELIVLAGDINRVSPRSHVSRNIVYKAAMVEAVAADVSEVSHEGYHLYKIPFKVSLANNEKTQIKFLDLKNIKIQRKYKTQARNPYYTYAEQKLTVTQYLEILSLEKALPMGTIRTYSKQDKTMLLVGESGIQHTPKHEKINITLGKNFDVKVKSNLIVNNSDRHFQDVKVAYEVTNRSDDKKVVEILVPHVKRSNAYSKITTSQKYTWKNGNMLSFKVHINADSKKRFEVQYKDKK